MAPGKAPLPWHRRYVLTAKERNCGSLHPQWDKHDRAMMLVIRAHGKGKKRRKTDRNNLAFLNLNVKLGCDNSKKKH